MNVEIGTEAAQFPENEYINGIFSASLSQNGEEGVFYLFKLFLTAFAARRVRGEGSAPFGLDA
jgi:hypothetical protein